MIGTDRIVSFWDLDLDPEIGPAISLDSKIPCLGGVVTDMIVHQKEKQLVTLVSNDHVFRVWDLSKKVSALFYLI